MVIATAALLMSTLTNGHNPEDGETKLRQKHLEVETKHISVSDSFNCNTARFFLHQVQIHFPQVLERLLAEGKRHVLRQISHDVVL